MELPLRVDRASARPLADQVAAQLREAALSGQLRIGERLPSTRKLAASLRVSRTVTAAAYDQLHAEGWISGRRGAGTFVAAVPAGSGCAPAAPRVELEPEEPPPVADLRPGSPWVAGIRSDVWRRAWRAAGDAAASGDQVRAGLPGFRQVVAEHVLRHRGLVVEPSMVLATAGTSAAVQEFARAVLPPGAVVAVEEPGYQRAVGALRAAGLTVMAVPVDRDGVVVAGLPASVHAVYCTPAHQFPLGGTLPAGRRIELVAWARERGAWIIEDDYDGDLRYDVAPLPLLASLGPDVVVHLGTTSKIFTPTLGCGWLVAPAEVTTAVTLLRNDTGTGPSAAGQRVFTAVAGGGDLARHLRRVRTELAARRQLVVAALTGAGQDVVGDRAGAHIVVPLPDTDTEGRLVAAARDHGLLVDGLGRYFAGRPYRAGLVIGYAAPRDRDVLSAGLEVIVALLHTSGLSGR